MAINQAIIRIRRGLKDELQIDKLLPGELAMATDAPCMWFCWSPGEVEQIPTSGNVIENISEIVSEYMANNDISVIGKVFMRIYNGWIQYSPDEKTWKNVISLADIRGDEGGYYIPIVNNDGTISWQPSQGGMEELQDSLILSKDIIEAVLGYVPLKKTDVVDNLVSTATKLPLSANQGGVLDGRITSVKGFMVSETWAIDPNTATTFFAIANGWSASKANFPAEFNNKYGLLETSWLHPNNIGSLTGTRYQVLIWEGYTAQRRYIDGAWTAWHIVSHETSDLTSSITISSKDSRISNVTLDAKRTGNVVTLFVKFDNCDFSTSNFTSGSNLDVKIHGIPMPSQNITACTYYTNRIFPVRLQPDGLIRVRNGAENIVTATMELNFSFTYVIS